MDLSPLPTPLPTSFTYFLYLLNWNYNSFGVYQLAKAFTVTKQRTYLDAATRQARLGIYPGQLTEGKYAGRWADPHNARSAYHYILVRGIAEYIEMGLN